MMKDNVVTMEVVSDMLDALIEFLGPIGKELSLIIVSMVPFIELRGAVPLGINAFGMDPVQVFTMCVLANCVPIPFVIFLIKPIFNWLKKFRPFKKLIEKIENAANKKSSKVTAYKYEMLGLFLFVAIPLPGTGAYSGALVAALLNMRVKHAFPAIVAGVVVAGILVTLIASGALAAWEFLI